VQHEHAVVNSMRLLEPEGEIKLTIAAMGDIGVIGSARTRARSEGYDAVFAAARPHLAGADVVFANFELPIGRPEWIRPRISREFWQDEEVCWALARAGARVVSLATNHMMDCGRQGLELTLKTCAAVGLQVMGAGTDLETARRPARLSLRGRRVVWLSYGHTANGIAGPTSPGIAPLDPDLIEEDLRRWRREADLLFVSMHWGSMYVEYPPPRVLELARLVASCGADLVVGHHPHVLQGAERIGSTLVLYSVGDMAFNCRSGAVYSHFNDHRDTAVFRAMIAPVPGLDVFPLGVDEDGFAVTPDPVEAEAVLQRLRRISDGLGRGTERYAEEAAPRLLQYELDSLIQHLRRGRIDLVFKLLLALRPRHLPLLWNGLRRSGKRRYRQPEQPEPRGREREPARSRER
jgi:poly-gamma-glutamate capsule biosynthesis protein CapA/YwtB (metallophosphatase superfamily)